MMPSDASVATASVTSTAARRIVPARDQRRGGQQQQSEHAFRHRHRGVDARALFARCGRFTRDVNSRLSRIVTAMVASASTAEKHPRADLLVPPRTNQVATGIEAITAAISP